MKKDEILEKSRKEKNDEAVKNINRMSDYTGLIFADILFLILSTFSNNILVNNLFLAVVGAQFFGQFVYQFLKQKKVSYLIVSLMGLAISVYGTLLFFNVI